METPTKPITACEKIRRMVDVTECAEQEARERYQTDPEYRAIVDELRKKNAERRANK